MSREKGHCPACDDDVDGERLSGQVRCPVCGTLLAPIASQRQSQVAEAQSTFQDLIDRLSNPDIPTSSTVLSKLKRIKPDPRHNCLEAQVEVKVSGIPGECLGMPASFGPISSVLDKPVRLCSPLTVSGKDLLNASEIKDNIAVALRGDNVSFAHKALVCQSAGAVAIIIIQTFDVWPFTPTDSANEIDNAGGLRIPVVAISSEAGKRLLDYIRTSSNKELAASTRIRGSLIFKSEDQDHLCAICHDSLVDHDVSAAEEESHSIVQLPCLHYFHEKCVYPWLKSKNTCPNCRYQLPSESGLGASARIMEEPGSFLGWFA